MRETPHPDFKAAEERATETLWTGISRRRGIF